MDRRRLAAAFIVELDDMIIVMDGEDTTEVYVQLNNDQLQAGWFEAKRLHDAKNAALST